MLPILKGKKETFKYVQTKKENPICGKCKYFVKTGQCLLVKSKISGSNGSCNFWEEGVPRLWPIHMPPLTKEEARYVEIPRGPKCGTCVFYESPRACELVKGDIDPLHGRCNAWKKKEKK